MNQDPVSPQQQPEPQQPQLIAPPAYQLSAPQYAPQPAPTPAVPVLPPAQPEPQAVFTHPEPAPQPQPAPTQPAFGPVQSDEPAAAPAQPVFPSAPPAQTPFQPAAAAAPFPGQPAASAPAAVNPGKTLGIIGLILDFFFAPAGLIVSLVAKHKSKKAGQKNGIALTGIILGIVFTVIGAAATVLVVVFVVAQPFAECAKLGNGTHVVGDTTYVCAPGSVKMSTGTSNPSSNF